jgi:type I restriction enzyme M protein
VKQPRGGRVELGRLVKKGAIVANKKKIEARKKIAVATSKAAKNSHQSARSKTNHAAQHKKPQLTIVRAPVIDPRIAAQLRDGPEQQLVVGPLVQRLLDAGWKLEQMMFGKKEWLVPKSPSEASKREKGRTFQGFPVDIAVFESPANLGDYNSLVFVIECKRPDETSGLEQLDIYFGREPHLRLGVWANSADASAAAVFLFRDEKGKTHPQKRTVAALPSPNSKIDKDYQGLTGHDLIVPSAESLSKVLWDMLGRIVARDSQVTRREEQLDQLCNVILLKLDSDKQARLNPSAEVAFRAGATVHATAETIRVAFANFVDNYPDIFTSPATETLRFSDTTLAECVDDLAPLNLLGVGPEVVSVAFQVLRSAALKQEEGQYFTPQPVIAAAVRAAGVTPSDLVLDPACGTGGFLVEAMVAMREAVIAAGGDPAEVPRWAMKALHGIDKDAIAVKLTKAVMQIMGDGAANCARGDSIATHRWAQEFPHLPVTFKDGRFSVIFTNPPFGAPLKVKRSEAIKAGLSIASMQPKGDIELGLAMLNRCHQLLRDGGKLCIVLPETYFFSPSYRFVREWCRGRFTPEVVLNVPMEAFQGFCRAKTNVYIFRKLPEYSGIKDAKKRAAAQEKELENADAAKVTMLNPRTCGIYKGGARRFKVTADGQRTDEIDNEMLEHVLQWRAGHMPPGASSVLVSDTVKKDVLVPAYYDSRYDAAFDKLKMKLGCAEITIGELLDDDMIEIRGGHGSPGNDVRVGSVPYVKVSDIRSLRVNVNPTNMIPRRLAEKFWRGKESGLKAWDLITPNRASSNIGEFAILIPGEEQLVLTKEMFVVRVTPKGLESFDPFYLLWALSLRAVRDQWRRVALMQTNREDVGSRHREIRLPWPPEDAAAKAWTAAHAADFKAYFEDIAKAKGMFHEALQAKDIEFIGSVYRDTPASEPNGEENGEISEDDANGSIAAETVVPSEENGS